MEGRQGHRQPGRLRRLSVLAAAASLLVATAPAAGAGQDPYDVGSGPGWVNVHAGMRGTRPGTHVDRSSGVTCTWKPSRSLSILGPDGQYEDQSVPKPGDPHFGDDGLYYDVTCQTGPLSWLYIFNQWVAANVPMVAPEVLAQSALKYLRMTPPAIRVNPSADRMQLVNLATWLWADRSTWEVQWAQASVVNESVTAVATPVRIIWDMGDGGRVVCDGPGTPYDVGRPPEGQRTDCSYTYRRASAGAPGGRFTVTATTVWRISWTATGVVDAAGTLPSQFLSSQTTLRVGEAQAIN